VTGRRTALVTAAFAVTGILSSCADMLLAGPLPEDQWEEVFEFELDPGTRSAAEVERTVGGIIPDGRIVPGSAAHRASIQAPSGRVDFYDFRVADSEMGPQPVFCSAMVSGTSMGAGCGNEPGIVEGPVQPGAESWGDRWRSAEFLVEANVARVDAIAGDGTVYTIIPANGLGYVEWLDERGPLDLVAFDAQGQELGRSFTESGG